MKMTANEKILGVETMKSRIELFHAERLARIGMEWKMDFFRTAGWSRAKILTEYRALPEAQETEPARSVDCHIPEPKSAAQIAEIIAINGRAALMG